MIIDDYSESPKIADSHRDGLALGGIIGYGKGGVDIVRSMLLRRTFVGVGSAVALRAAAGRKTTDRPALLGGDRVRSKEFPSWPQTRPEDEKNWLDVLRACKWWRKQGHYVRDFEKA